MKTSARTAARSPVALQLHLVIRNQPNWHLHAQRRLSMGTDIDKEPVRRAEVNRIVESYGGPGLYGASAGGYENGFLIIEATRCYHLGADLACILCAHACCERELAGTLKWQHPPTPNTKRWGLAALSALGEKDIGSTAT